jgi:hypothetical protein
MTRVFNPSQNPIQRPTELLDGIVVVTMKAHDMLSVASLYCQSAMPMRNHQSAFRTIWPVLNSLHTIPVHSYAAAASAASTALLKQQQAPSTIPQESFFEVETTGSCTTVASAWARIGLNLKDAEVLMGLDLEVPGAIVERLAGSAILIRIINPRGEAFGAPIPLSALSFSHATHRDVGGTGSIKLDLLPHIFGGYAPGCVQFVRSLLPLSLNFIHCIASHELPMHLLSQCRIVARVQIINVIVPPRIPSPNRPGVYIDRPLQRPLLSMASQHVSIIGTAGSISLFCPYNKMLTMSSIRVEGGRDLLERIDLVIMFDGRNPLCPSGTIHCTIQASELAKHYTQPNGGTSYVLNFNGNNNPMGLRIFPGLFKSMTMNLHLRPDDSAATSSVGVKQQQSIPSDARHSVVILHSYSEMVRFDGNNATAMN